MIEALRLSQIRVLFYLRSTYFWNVHLDWIQTYTYFTAVRRNLFKNNDVSQLKKGHTIEIFHHYILYKRIYSQLVYVSEGIHIKKMLSWIDRLLPRMVFLSHRKFLFPCPFWHRSDPKTNRHTNNTETSHLLMVTSRWLLMTAIIRIQFETIYVFTGHAHLKPGRVKSSFLF